ncbi:hypothetical protein BJV74DRAFT_867724, partial [Russula compacta]
TQIEINNLVCFAIQLFYARRVYLLSNSLILSLVIAGLSCLYFGIGLEFLIKIWIFKSYSLYRHLTWQATVALSVAASADILIAASMSWCLYRCKIGFAKTDFMITTLITYSVSTGLLTSILAVSTLICFLVVPFGGVLSQAFFWPLGKCYVNSLLTMLNNRDLLQGRSASAITRADSTFAMATPSSYRNKTTSTPVAVTVYRTHVSESGSDFPAAGKNDYVME